MEVVQFCEPQPLAVQPVHATDFTDFAEYFSADHEKRELCNHPAVYGGSCVCCSQQLDDDDESGAAFYCMPKGLRFSNHIIDRIRKSELQNLLNKRKLCLVLDLDHTLLHSTHMCNLSPEEEKMEKSNSWHCGDIFRWEDWGMLTKLRPFVFKFLEEASELFETYIFTKGIRVYAMSMASILDPENKYFNFKVIAREDCTEKDQKSLDIVPVHESGVVILDDKESVWARHTDNLILMEKYKYFSSIASDSGLKSTSHSEMGSDESEVKGALNSILGVLKRIHSSYFEVHDIVDCDVRDVLDVVRKEVLRGCELVFGKDVTTETTEYCQLKRMAEQMGASCSEEYGSNICPFVTHVVSMDAKSAEARWAMAENTFLVNPKWVIAAYHFWKRLPEEEFAATESDSYEDNIDNAGENQQGLRCEKHSRTDDNNSQSASLAKRQKC